MSAQITVSIFEPISSVSHNERFTLTYPIVTLIETVQLFTAFLINHTACNPMCMQGGVLAFSLVLVHLQVQILSQSKFRPRSFFRMTYSSASSIFQGKNHAA